MSSSEMMNDADIAQAEAIASDARNQRSQHKTVLRLVATLRAANAKLAAGAGAEKQYADRICERIVKRIVIESTNWTRAENSPGFVASNCIAIVKKELGVNVERAWPNDAAGAGAIGAALQAITRYQSESFGVMVMRPDGDWIKRTDALGVLADAARGAGATGGGWVSVKDRLPDSWGYYLTTFERTDCFVVCKWNDMREWSTVPGAHKSVVTHWRELPAAPVAAGTGAEWEAR